MTKIDFDSQRGDSELDLSVRQEADRTDEGPDQRDDEETPLRLQNSQSDAQLHRREVLAYTQAQELTKEVTTDASRKDAFSQTARPVKDPSTQMQTTSAESEIERQSKKNAMRIESIRTAVESERRRLWVETGSRYGALLVICAALIALSWVFRQSGMASIPLSGLVVFVILWPFFEKFRALKSFKAEFQPNRVNITAAAANSDENLLLREELVRRRLELQVANTNRKTQALLPESTDLGAKRGKTHSGATFLPEVSEVHMTKAEKAKAAEIAPAGGENLASLLTMDELTLEIGFQLIPLVDEKQGGQMLNRVRALRRHLATELGFIVPPVHITDNLRLKPRDYVVSLRGIEIARWQTEQNALLAVNADPRARPIEGIETREPAFGVAACWIQKGLEDTALAAGYSVVDSTTVIATHLGELIRRHAHELLGRQETKRLLDALGEGYPKLVEELVPTLMTLGEVQKVLQQLLREQVSIRDLGAILEILVEAAQKSKNLVHLVESVRQQLGRGLISPLLDAEGGLKVLTIEQNLEAELVATFDPHLAQEMGPGTLRARQGENLRKLLESVKRLTGGGTTMALPVLLCPSPARYHVRRWLEPFVPKVTVLAPEEIPAEIRIRVVGTVG